MARRLVTDVRDAANAVRDAASELRLVDTTQPPSSLDLDELGAIAVLLALRWPAWVDRREMEIRFVDDATVRITTAVSFHLTREAVGADLPAGSTLYVPMDTPEKRTLLNLRIADEDGTLLTPLNTVRNGDLAGRGLVRLFSQLLHSAGLDLPDASGDALRELPASPLKEAQALQSTVLDSKGVLGQWLREGPNKDRPEIQIIKDLTQGFLHLVQIEYEPDRDRRIEIGHDLPLPWPKKQDKKWAVALGALSQQRTFEPVSIGKARSTHVEFVAPEDMDLVSAKLQGKQYDTSGDVHRELRVNARSFERSSERARLHVLLLAGSEIHDSTVLPPENGRTVTPHEKRTQLQIEGTSDQAESTVSLLPRRSGTIPAAGLASVATAITLGIFASRLRELDGQTGAAVLLLLPAVLAAYLSRPGEHRFTTRALRATRVLASLSAACAVVLSGMIAGGFLSSGAKGSSPAPASGTTTSASLPHNCTATGRLGVVKRAVGAPLQLSIRCRSSSTASRTAKTSGASRPGVPTVAKYVAVGLAIISGFIALVLVLAWGSATLMARLVPSDDESAKTSSVPKHP